MSVWQVYIHKKNRRTVEARPYMMGERLDPAVNVPTGAVMRNGSMIIRQPGSTKPEQQWYMYKGAFHATYEEKK